MRSQTPKPTEQTPPAPATLPGWGFGVTMAPSPPCQGLSPPTLTPLHKDLQEGFPGVSALLRAEPWHQTGSEPRSFPQNSPAMSPAPNSKINNFYMKTPNPGRDSSHHTGFSNKTTFSSKPSLNLATEGYSQTSKPCSLLRSCCHMKVGSFSRSPGGRSSDEHMVPDGVCQPHPCNTQFGTETGKFFSKDATFQD